MSLGGGGARGWSGTSWRSWDGIGVDLSGGTTMCFSGVEAASSSASDSTDDPRSGGRRAKREIRTVFLDKSCRSKTATAAAAAISSAGRQATTNDDRSICFGPEGFFAWWIDRQLDLRFEQGPITLKAPSTTGIG